eukprot:m.333980 g.333980  ORF g.333980 m.333980 type:complete len:433 (+) comp17260_c0_seq1:114-1412(+)
MISGLFIFSHKGDPIISRIYRDDITKAVQDAFRVHVIHSRTGVRSPVISIEKKSYFHINRNNLYLVAVTCQNANACMIFEFLRKFLDLCSAYFGAFNEVNVKNNFSLIYELLDEVLDNGYPQSTDPDALKIITEEAAKKGASLDDMKQIASQVTGQIGWRREGIKYRKHEVYLDVVEKVNCQISPSGHVLSNFVAGAIQVKCHLSGMPECKFGINDKLVAGNAPKDDGKKKKKQIKSPIALDDLTFHQCVRLGKFDQNRSISFVPPDGEFDLVKYRTTTDVHLPFTIKPMLQEYGNVMDMTVNIKGEFESKYLATAVVVTIPIPTSASKVTVQAKNGKAKYKAGANNVVWKMRTFSGQKSATCSVKIDLLKVTGKNKWTRPPINVSFEVPFACSGLQVKYLRVSERKLGYDESSVLKWVRYLSSAGDYDARY